MGNNLTEMQVYRIGYIRERKKRIIKRLEEIHEELKDPGLLYEKHKTLVEEKKNLCKEFDAYADEYRSIIQARKRYELYSAEAAKLKRKWGFEEEPNE